MTVREKRRGACRQRFKQEAFRKPAFDHDGPRLLSEPWQLCLQDTRGQENDGSPGEHHSAKSNNPFAVARNDTPDGEHSGKGRSVEAHDSTSHIRIYESLQNCV